MSEEVIRCVECGCFVDYEDAYVKANEVNEEGDTIEVCCCKWCWKEIKGQ